MQKQFNTGVWTGKDGRVEAIYKLYFLAGLWNASGAWVAACPAMKSSTRVRRNRSSIIIPTARYIKNLSYIYTLKNLHEKLNIFITGFYFMLKYFLFCAVRQFTFL